jgi:hypothetical protein
MKSSWRATAAPIISKVIKDTTGLPEKDVKKAIREAYPFGARMWHPYKIWCDEVNKQLGKKKKKPVVANQTEIF